MKNKLLVLLMAAIMAFGSFAYAAPETDSSERERSQSTSKSDFPKPNAKAAIVIDEKSGDAIFAMNADRKVFPAGTSNIMTAMIALESAKLTDVCTVSEAALANVSYDQPQLGMLPGETYTVEQLLHAIIMNSNNDAANTLAITVAGSLEGFVQKMNDKAQELGMTGTHFANPTGWHDENHYTTATDMAKLARYAMKNPTFREIVLTQKYVFPATNMRSKEKTILSTNHLVSRYKYPYHYYPNATGIKSGNSTNAGYCLVASAEKGQFSLISVVMNCPNENANEGAYSFTDTKAMFDYILKNYQTVELAKQGDVIYDSKVKEAKDSTRLALTVDSDLYTTMKGTVDPQNVERNIEVTKEAVAPIALGDVFGTVTYSYNGKILKTANLVAANEVKRDVILHIINLIFGFIFNPFVIIIVILAVLFYLRLRSIKNRKRKIRQSRLASYRRENERPKTARDSYTSRSNRTSRNTRNSRSDRYRRR